MLIKCPDCNHPISSAAYTICPNCGRKIGKKVKKTTDLLLCFFGGALGAHKIYEGKYGLAVLYAFTLGGIGLFVIIDLIKILLQDEYFYA